MPIYEYRCGKCGQVFEALVVKPDEEVVCPDCGTGRPQRVLSTFARTASTPEASSCSSPSGFS